MPQFALYAMDGPDGPARRNDHRDGHVAHIAGLDAAGHIAFAGPLKDPANGHSIGVLIVYNAQDEAAARKMVDEDPYVAGGVFDRTELLPVLQVYPKSA